MIGDSITQNALIKGLDGNWRRQQAIAHNIANHETPGFKALKVSFEEELAATLKKIGQTPTLPGGAARARSQVASVALRTEESRRGGERADGNNVNLDEENVLLAKSQIQYMYLTRALTDYYGRLRYVISEGKR